MSDDAQTPAVPAPELRKERRMRAREKLTSEEKVALALDVLKRSFSAVSRSLSVRGICDVLVGVTTSIGYHSCCSVGQRRLRDLASITFTFARATGAYS